MAQRQAEYPTTPSRRHKDVKLPPTNESSSSQDCTMRTASHKKGSIFRWVDDPLTSLACSEFSLQALPRAFAQESSRFRRLLWFLLFLVGTAMTIVTVMDTLMDYLQYESMTSIVNEEPGEEGIVFPAVSFWNHNPAKMGLMNSSMSAREICYTVGDVNEDGVHSGKGLPESWDVGMSWEVAHSAEDMVVECEWGGKPCEEDAFYAALTPAPNTRWGIGYTFNHLSKERSNQAGRPDGLHLVLDIQSDEYCLSVWDRGVRIEFHDHQDLPVEVSATHIDPMLGDSVSPGYRWSFSLKRVESHSLGHPYGRRCIDLRGGEEYPNPNEAQECASACPGVEEKDINEITLLSTTNECVIECFRARSYRFCDGVTFPFSLGQSKITVPHFTKVDSILLESLRNSFVARFIPDDAQNMTPEKLRNVLQHGVDNNIVVIDFYYKEMLTERRVETPQQSFWSTIGEVGGLVGLFLGASLITGFEFIEILCMLFCGYADRHVQQKPECERDDFSRRTREIMRIPTSQSIFKKYALKSKSPALTGVEEVI